jgi:protein-tyrosine phosphatase
MHIITDSLLVGNIEDARKLPSSIGGLLLVADEYEIIPPHGIAYARVPLKEFTEADPHDMERAVAWLERHIASKRLIVCCRAGMGRSVSVVIAYLCCVKGMSYVEAVAFVKARRPGATPLPRLEQTINEVQQLRLARDPKGQDQPNGHKAARNPASR